MYGLMDSSHELSQCYFLLLITIGSFFLLNLLVVVLSANYTRYREQHELGLKQHEKDGFKDVAVAAQKRHRDEEEKR